VRKNDINLAFSLMKYQILGDQAEIVFSLIGTPPFTFTYQRSEPSPKKGGKPGKVLETYTVSQVTGPEYSIFSALEGM
jgi:nucleoporin POM152